MRVLVCGGRDFTDREYVFKRLDQLHAKYPITCIIHGAARGADSLAGEWARQNGIPEEKYPVTAAEWKEFGKAAGILRNVEMLLKGKPDCTVAFPGGRGTAHMVDISAKGGVKVWDVRGGIRL